MCCVALKVYISKSVYHVYLAQRSGGLPVPGLYEVFLKTSSSRTLSPPAPDPSASDYVSSLRTVNLRKKHNNVSARN